jgi:hypothetical protein
LWVGVKALFDRRTHYKQLVIYSGDEGLSKQRILDHVKVDTHTEHTYLQCAIYSACIVNLRRFDKDRFGIEFTKEEAARINIVSIQSRTLLDAKW